MPQATRPRRGRGAAALVTGSKIILPLAVIVWLVWRTPPTQLQQLRGMNKNWWLLTASLVLAMAALVNTFVRWQMLVRSLHIPFRLADALRLGFLGFLLNFVSVGVVGGDLFKAIFIARERPRKRPEAVASVLVDRVIGLYALLIVASVAVLLTWREDMPVDVRAVSQATLVATVLGAVAMGILALPGFTTGALAEMLTRLPRVGGVLERLIGALRMYRRRPGILAIALVQSFATHVLFAMSLYCIARALFPVVPTLGEHLVIVPLSMVAGSLPFTPAGLGAFELAMESLYKILPVTAHAVSGVIVALVFRLIQIVMAGLGLCYYWSAQAEWDRIQQEAQRLGGQDAEGEDESSPVMDRVIP